MNSEKHQNQWHKVFEFGIILKAINGAWELVGALLLLAGSRLTHNFFLSLTRKELFEDRDDRILAFLVHSWQASFGHTKTFFAAYILIHAVLNIFLAISLYKEKLWAYQVSLAVTGIFVIYQIYRAAHSHGWLLIAITVWDIIFMVVTWHEFKRKAHSKFQMPKI